MDAKLTTAQAREKFKSYGATDTQLDAMAAKGVDLSGLLQWLAKYGPPAYIAIQELIALLSGVTPAPAP